MTALIVIGVILFILVECWPYLAIFAAIVVAVAIIVLVVDSISTKNITKDVDYAVFLGRMQYMTTRSRPSGYSISSRGNFRAYWRFRDEVDHVEATFEVHYMDGSVKIIKANEGTELYNRLVSYIGVRQNAGVSEQRAEIPEKESKPPEKQKLPPVDPKRTSGAATKRYIDVPFEVAENEYKLSVLYPSCQMEIRENGESRINVRFSAAYDPTVKGVRNRIVTCATIDKFGRMTGTATSYKTLDSSGSRIVDVSFRENADEEPAKILVGLDRYN